MNLEAAALMGILRMDWTTQEKGSCRRRLQGCEGDMYCTTRYVSTLYDLLHTRHLPCTEDSERLTTHNCPTAPTLPCARVQ